VIGSCAQFDGSRSPALSKKWAHLLELLPENDQYIYNAL